MSWPEGYAALQLIAEMEYGAPMRKGVSDENAAEDATKAALKAAGL